MRLCEYLHHSLLNTSPCYTKSDKCHKFIFKLSLYSSPSIAPAGQHAFGGIAPILGSWRVPHRTPIQGVWFIGAQSESGGGVNNVIPGAYKTAKAILNA
jgi:hypothetical protein